MSLPIIVLASGGHAKVIINALLLMKVNILGIVDNDYTQRGKNVLGIPVMGDDEIVLTYKPEKIFLVNGLGSFGLPEKRRTLFEKFKNKGYKFASVIHPSAVIAPDVKLMEGVQVMAGSVIQPGCVIGSNSIINTKTSVDHDCIVGNHVHLAPNVTLSGGIRVGNSAHVGAGATVIQGITISQNSIVGAGSLVLKNIPENVTVVGVPARVIKK